MKTYRFKTFLIILFILASGYQTLLSQSGTDTLTIEKDSVSTVDSVSSVQEDSVSQLSVKDSGDDQSIKEIITSSKIFLSLLILLIGFYVIKIFAKILNIFAEKSATYRITLKGTIPVVRILGWIVVFYIVLAIIIQPPLETVIAVTASVGIAVGLAAQDILKNVFGGIMILFDRPFQVGDKIEVASYYGEVVKIGLRSTRIVTADDSLVSIPNSEIMNQSVSNSNAGEPNCQVVAEIYLPIDVDTEKARKIAMESAQVSKYIYLNKPITVLFFNEVKERRSYLKMRLKAYVMDIRYEFAHKSDMTEIVIRELIQKGVIKKEDLF